MASQYFLTLTLVSVAVRVLRQVVYGMKDYVNIIVGKVQTCIRGGYEAIKPMFNLCGIVGQSVEWSDSLYMCCINMCCNAKQVAYV